MDACTMIQFQNATLHPDKYLSRYKELRFEHETLSRTKYFAECRAELHGKRFMVYAPITTSSMARVLKAIETLSNGCNWIQINNNYTPPVPSKHINTLEIAHDAMLCDNRHCSIILEPLPDGILLAEALYTHTNKHLTAGLEELQDDLAPWGPPAPPPAWLSSWCPPVLLRPATSPCLPPCACAGAAISAPMYP